MAAVGGVYVSVTGEGWERSLAQTEAMLQAGATENQWAMAVLQATAALGAALLGRTNDALRWLAAALPAIERAPGSAPTYPQVLGDRSHGPRRTRADGSHRESRTQPAREVAAARLPLRDVPMHATPSRCSAASRGEFEEAAEWFAKARVVFEEQGAAPMRALTDFYEARMYVRREAAGDRERAATLLQAALEQFGPLGMTGWARRAEAMLQSLNAPADRPARPRSRSSPPPRRPLPRRTRVLTPYPEARSSDTKATTGHSPTTAPPPG